MTLPILHAMRPPSTVVAMTCRTALLIVAAVLIGCARDATEQTVYMRPNYNDLTWQQAEFTVKAGTRIKLVMDNIATGLPNVMSHNVVVLNKRSTPVERDALVEAVGTAANEAGEANEYFPNHPDILLRTPLAAPGKTTEIVFVAPDPGDYPYICTFAGHWKTMRGVMHVVE